MFILGLLHGTVEQENLYRINIDLKVGLSIIIINYPVKKMGQYIYNVVSAKNKTVLCLISVQKQEVALKLVIIYQQLIHVNLALLFFANTP